MLFALIIQKSTDIVKGKRQIFRIFSGRSA